jgi:aryl-alcohol dehydrogenase-like predicted oxidoreductase
VGNARPDDAQRQTEGAQYGLSLVLPGVEEGFHSFRGGAEILATCRELCIGFVPYSPLGRGFLTGKIRQFDDLADDDWRRHGPRFQGEDFEQNLAIVRHLEALAHRKHCKPAQLALAWVLAQGDDVVPIPGTKRRTNLEENVAALEIELTTGDLAELSETAPVGATAGARYPTASMAAVNR